MNWKLISLGLLMISSCAFSSNDVMNTKTQNTISQNTAVNTSHIGTAIDWALTDTEWKRYLILMQGPSGHYYTNLSPPEILGIYADNAEDLQHFAKVAAKSEHDKLERELRFNVAFHQSATKLYATEPIIQPFDYMPFTPIPKN
jgi:integrating conjugative element protein (TIGR03759 family)